LTIDPDVAFEKSIMKAAKSGDVRGTIFSDSFLDIGTPEDYYKAPEIVR
jgi:NDP-sugar pyrophosphorylase family protein